MTTLTHDRRHPDTSRIDAAVATSLATMEGLIAAYALMAHADGEVAGAERRRMFAILRENVAMTAFSRDELAEEIAMHEANFRFDPEVAQQIAREKLAPVAQDRRAALRIVAACRELIPADGVAHPAEYRVLGEIRSLLQIDDDKDSAIPREAARLSSRAGHR